MDLDLARQLAQENGSKIVLFVMDGLGGLPHPDTGRTELESAYTTHLDMLARESACGFTLPVAPGVTPGSGPGHLALFGYDPLKYNIGRGALEAVGIDFDLRPDDVAARGNFCTVDEQGRITDRRAGRIDTERCAELCAALRQVRLDGALRPGSGQAELFVEPVREHRFVLVLRGSGLSDAVADTDPQGQGAAPLPPRATSPEGEATARLVSRFVEEAQRLLADKSPANMLLLRGFARRPDWPSMGEVFKLRPAAVAHYPMYRGLAKLVGMAALPTGPGLEDSIATLRENWGRFDYFFVHYKYTDTAGEDGDFDRKVQKLTEVDAALPSLLALAPDVLMVAGDHSTPAVLGAHSWHPVPFMLRAKWTRADECDAFNEVVLQKGSLGTFPAVEALPLALAHAGRLRKFGA
ncbi:MAG TPA: 2,3-bisphosphoglycerate-independent phosphoglycerate mutase [Dehalococcoidia bacterium]|nr:2,3-bisphosphoglycerate-independent phosphoglycerate mutase [Dehalococcoidia bacterium]